MSHFAVRKVLPILLLLIGVPLLSYGCWQSFKPTIGSSVTGEQSPVTGLPEDATNVRYFLPGTLGPAKYYDFNTSEAHFEKWAAAMNLEFSREDGGTIYALQDDGRPRVLRPICGPVLWWRDPDHSDSSVVVAYDREAGRAFYQMHSR